MSGGGPKILMVESTDTANWGATSPRQTLWPINTEAVVV